MGRTDRIERALQRHVEAGHFAGVEWHVERAGQTLSTGRLGMADPAAGTPLPDSPIYRIYSMTKPVTSALAVMLIGEGRLRLYDPVAAYIPEFAQVEVAAPDGARSAPRRTMMVEHLMTHRAGLSYGFLGNCHVAPAYRAAQWGGAGASLERFARTVAALPLAFEPGSAFRYSVATDILGRVVEVAAGQSLESLVEERITGPLGLRDTGYAIPAAEQHRLLPMFGETDINRIQVLGGGPQRLNAVDLSHQHPPSGGAARGGTGLFSTLDDYVRIARFFLDGRASDGGALLSEAALTFMWMNRIPPEMMPLAVGLFPMPGYGYSLAGRVMVDPGRAFTIARKGEYGWAGAASTWFMVDPGERMTAVLMTQYLGGTAPLADDFRSAVYASLD